MLHIKFNIAIEKSHELFKFLGYGYCSCYIGKIEYNNYLNELMVYVEMYSNEKELKKHLIDFSEFEGTDLLNGMSWVTQNGHLVTFNIEKNN